MIKRGTLSHSILLAIVDNPMDIDDLAKEIDSDRSSIRSFIRCMRNKQGVNIKNDGNVFSISSEDMPEFGMYAHELIYIHMLEHGSISNPQIRQMISGKHTSGTIGLVMKRLERDFGVNLVSELVPNKGKRSMRIWRLA